MTEMNNLPPQGGAPQGQVPQPPVSPQQPVYSQPGYAPITPQQNSAHGMAVASMVLGIISLVLCWFFYLSLPCGIVGLILGIIAIKRGQRGMAVAGVVCSSIALLVAVIVMIAAIIALSAATSIINNIY